MAALRHCLCVATLTWAVALAGCGRPGPSEPPPERPPTRFAPVLGEDDEALLASLLADDPGDFYGARARVWRAGPARWREGGPELPARPSAGVRDGSFAQGGVEVVVIDEDALAVLLPLAELGVPGGEGLRLVARLQSADLVPGLAHELRPTPWLTLAAGVGLSALASDREGAAGPEQVHLRVRWSDPACGFGLELKIDPGEFGPLYVPGPAGRPGDGPAHDEDGPALRLAPGTQLYADADGREPIIRLDPEPAGEADRLRAAQRIRRLGKPKGKLQAIELRCRGVVVTGYAPTTSLVELPGRFALVEPELPPSSSCAGFGPAQVPVPAATVLFEPDADASAPVVVGVVAREVELAARASADGWWQACVPSPWGDLLFDFQLR